MKITYEQIKNNPTARALVEKADEAMFNIGYTCLLYTSRCV